MTGNSIEIEELVRVAAQEKTSTARNRLFCALRRVELFFPLKIKHHEGKEVKATPLLRLKDGSHAMMLYTSKSHPDLTDSFAGGSFNDALTAALKMPALDWVILSNLASQWVAVEKQQIAAILGDLNGDSKEANGYPTTSGSSSAGEMLDELITRAVHSKPEDISPPINSILAGRELFLELNSGQSEGVHSTMSLFQVNELPNVVRAYLSRSRSGITYGGIKWEALKEMIRNEPRIDGVQIINDAYDWVVFDRESLK